MQLTGFSLRWLLLLWSRGSRPHSRRCCGSWTLEHGLSRYSTRTPLPRSTWDLPNHPQTSNAKETCKKYAATEMAPFKGCLLQVWVYLCTRALPFRHLSPETSRPARPSRRPRPRASLSQRSSSTSTTALELLERPSRRGAHLTPSSSCPASPYLPSPGQSSGQCNLVLCSSDFSIVLPLCP